MHLLPHWPQIASPYNLTTRYVDKNVNKVFFILKPKEITVKLSIFRPLQWGENHFYTQSLVAPK